LLSAGWEKVEERRLKGSIGACKGTHRGEANLALETAWIRTGIPQKNIRSLPRKPRNRKRKKILTGDPVSEGTESRKNVDGRDE